MLPARIVAIGASSLFGRIDHIGGGFVGRLKTWHEAQDPENVVFNLGIPGDTTRGLLSRFVPEVGIRRPDMILVSIGLNDTRRTGGRSAPNATSLDDFKKNILEIIEKGRALGDIVFASISPIDENRTAPFRTFHQQESDADDIYFLLEDAKQYAEATREICEGYKVPYLDAFEKMMSLDYIPLLAADGLHCNPTGHQKIFEELREFLLETYRH